MPFLGLDLTEAARLVQTEKYGDWYRDPWGWPECSSDFVATLTPDDFGIEKSGRLYKSKLEPAFHVFDVPKSYLGIRPAVVQDSRSRVAYAAGVLSMAKGIHFELPSWVFGWRVRDEGIARNGDEWDLYRASLSGIRDGTYAAQTDLTSFFSSVEVSRLLRDLREMGIEGAGLSLVESVLLAHDALGTRSGLPQRSVASSLLAQVAMRPIDEVIEASLQEGHVTAARRWMDDISFEGEERYLYGLISRLQERGREVGLEINASKTFTVPASESADRLDLEALRLIRVPKAPFHDDYADLFSTFVEPSELLKAEEDVLSNPRAASRSFAGLVLRTLVHNNQYERSADWMGQSHLLPHAADHLGRFLASAYQAMDFDAWIGVERWFVKAQTSGWPHHDWVSAQHALALPSDQLDEAALDILRGWLQGSHNLQKVAVAVQRLAQREPARTRSAISARMDKTHDPLLVRLLALGHLSSGGSRTLPMAALDRHTANRFVLRHLEHVSWRLPVVSNDFDPSVSEDAPNG